MNKVAILIGSETDRPIIEKSRKYFDYFSIDFEIHVLSAHRNPNDVADFCIKAKDNGYHLVSPDVAIYSRLLYKNQKNGEWLRFATPMNSMIDSDGVPHLPKLGKALGYYFVETYWSYPKAIFHPHNEFVVMKNVTK